MLELITDYERLSLFEADSVADFRYCCTKIKHPTQIIGLRLCEPPSIRSHPVAVRYVNGSIPFQFLHQIEPNLQQCLEELRHLTRKAGNG